MSNARTREDEAAWKAFVGSTKQGEQCMAVMRRIIDAVDRQRAKEAGKDKDEANHEEEPMPARSIEPGR